MSFVSYKSEALPGAAGMPPQPGLDPRTPLPARATGPASSNIGEAVSIVGKIFAREDLSIAGRVKGTIQCRGAVVVLSGGQVLASIMADSVVISGSVEGAVEATDQIDIRKGANLVGDIKCSRIVIEDGAYFKGMIDIQSRRETQGALAVEGSPEAEEFDRIAESDVSDGRYTTFFENAASLERVFSGKRSNAPDSP
jgi:cytoskeletal protein CcmA (bactofilin family)